MHEIVLSGLRPTGRVHLGNYFGAVRNWVDLQNSGKYRCLFFVADLHALTTDYADTSSLAANTREAVLDWLAVGLDPSRSTIFLQSRVPQHAELALYFSMITPLGWLERVPTYKDQIEQLRSKDLGTHGFLGYPVLMTADIAVYLANWVPVGEDQASHLEICREIVRRFNGLYGEVFPEPKALFTPTPKVNGIDGRKMSKSYGNTIGITEAAESVQSKVMAMVTRPGPRAPPGPGQPRELQPVSLPRALLAARRGRGRRPGVPDGDPRLRRLQEAPDREPERGSRAFSEKARGASRGLVRRRARRAPRGRREGPPDRRRDHGAGARGREAGAGTVREVA